MNTDNSVDTRLEPNSETISSKQSRLISKVLSPAVRLWLRSQVQQVSSLEVQISGSDRQVLTGYIPRISISACHAVYKGLYLEQIDLVGEGIRTNLGQVLKGHPLRLLEPVPVFGKLLLQESDLNASLQSPLLANALTELLGKLLQAFCPVDEQVSWHKITIDSGSLILHATSAADTSNPTAVMLRTGLKLASCHELQLEQPQLQMQGGSPLVRNASQMLGGVSSEFVNLDSFKLDLGPEVALQELTLNSGQLTCCGRIYVNP